LLKIFTARAHPHAARGIYPTCEGSAFESVLIQQSCDYNKSSSPTTLDSLRMHAHSSRGFTLIEIAVVVALIAILLTAGAKIAGGLMEAAAVSVTQKKQQAIKEVLLHYFNRNKRLPCPDTARDRGDRRGFTLDEPPDGTENRNGLDCAYPFGVVPYAELGLPQEMALDGWQNYFFYRVTEGYAWNKSGESNAGTRGGIEVKARDPAGEKVTAPADDGAVFAIISTGRDGAGVFTVAGSRTLPPPDDTDERDNVRLADFIVPPPTPPIWARDATDKSIGNRGAFDDVVLFVRPSDIFSISSATANQDFQDKVARARLAILGHSVILSDCRLPQHSGTPTGYDNLGLEDIWGNKLEYRRLAASRISNFDSDEDVFSIKYPGRDPVVIKGREVRGHVGASFLNNSPC
jgi:prepilin-type N-terminal cleavage/methylation domain-containing protein